MEDLGLKLHPLSQLQLYRAIRDSIFHQMDSKVITPERADEILSYVKDQVVLVKNPEHAKKFYEYLGEKFPELAGVSHAFELEEQEKIDELLTVLLDLLLEKKDFELADKIMQEVESVENHERSMDFLQQKYPQEFADALEKMGQQT